MYGMAVCKAGTRRPVFVSVGHRLSLATATSLVLSCMRHKTPEPIRQADLRSRERIRSKQQHKLETAGLERCKGLPDTLGGHVPGDDAMTRGPDDTGG